MKVVTKLALALFVGVFVVVAAFTALRVRGEIRLFDEDVRRVQRIVGLTAAAALAKTRTQDEAAKLAARVDASRENIRIRFVSLAGATTPERRPLVALAPGAGPAPGQWRQVVKPPDEREREADLLVTYVGAPVADDPHGALELAQPLAPRAEYVWRGIWTWLASALAMLVVGGMTTALIGAKVVGQPVLQLIQATRRIAEGDFNVLHSIRRRDEFGELADALRAMSRELQSERLRTRREAEARILALEQVRHADRLTTLGQLASVLAHEIGTPLNVIAGHGKLIATGRLANEAVTESAVAIGEQSERITRIVRRILDYARRRPARRARLDASGVVRNACALLQGLASQRGVTLEVVEVSTEPETTVDADPDQLQQAVTNLVLNALHVSAAQGSVRVTVSRVEREVDGQAAPWVALSVQDFGAGVPEDLRQRIFEPFFTTKPPGEGTGLGLSIVKDIVDEHGGIVELSTSEGGGAIFTIYLPRSVSDVD